MKEYHKIETLFERDLNGTKKLIEGKFRNPAIEYLKDNQWQFTEKIDGTNIRIYWDGHKITIGGRTDNAQIHGGLIQKLNELFGGETNAQIFEQQFGNKAVYLIGEGYGAGIQTGGGYREDKSFILFDVMVSDIFLPREAVEVIAQAFNIDVVPIIMTGTIDEAVQFIKTKPMSTIGTMEMEGVVGKPLVEMTDVFGNRMIVKIKVCDF